MLYNVASDDLRLLQLKPSISKLNSTSRRRIHHLDPTYSNKLAFHFSGVLQILFGLSVV